MRLGFLSVAFSLASVIAPSAAQDTIDPAALLAQLQQQLPECALNVLLTEIPRSACALTDLNCICTNEPLNNAILASLMTCPVVDQLQTQKFQMTTCGAPVRDISTRITAITWSFFSIAMVFVILRLIGRLPAFGGSFSWDDYTIIACLLALTPTSVIAQLLIDHGLGQDIWMLEPDEVSNTLFYFWIEEFLYTFLVVFTKISILLFYLRIFTGKNFRFQCFTLIAVIGLFGIACVISTGLYCTPISWVWDGWRGEMPKNCVNINAQTYAFAGINMSLDILIFVLPIPQLWALQMNIKKKLAVASMFVVGLFVTICSVVRLQTALKWGKSMNPTYDYANLAIWSLIEIDVGVICACMPGIANLMRRIWPRIFGTKAGTYGKSDHSSKSSGLGGKFSRMDSEQKIQANTTVSISYAGRNNNDTYSAKTDELELVPPHYGRHENKTAWHDDSSDPETNTGNRTYWHR